MANTCKLTEAQGKAVPYLLDLHDETLFKPHRSYVLAIVKKDNDVYIVIQHGDDRDWYHWRVAGEFWTKLIRADAPWELLAFTS